MHYTVKYNPEYDETIALRDICEWLTPQQYNAAQELARENNLELFRLGLSFAGVSGYPVEALFNHFQRNNHKE